MTVPHNVPAVGAPSLVAALGALRRRGLRVSLARRHVLEVLYAADAPLSADAIAERLAGADLASIYRNLDVLEELGLVRHMHLGHSPSLYSLAAGRDVEFAACERCGRFEALEPGRLDPVRHAIEAECGFVARFTHFPIVGVCPACQFAPNQESSHHAHP